VSDVETSFLVVGVFREYARDKNMTESTGLQFIGLALSFQLVIINWSLQRMNDILDGIQRTLEEDKT